MLARKLLAVAADMFPRVFLHRAACLIVLVTVALAAPGGSLAAASEHHPCAQKQHGCSTTALVSCCCQEHQDQSPPATPAQPQVQLLGIAAIASPIAVLPEAAAVDREQFLRHWAWPPGYHSIDLTILLSTFLI